MHVRDQVWRKVSNTLPAIFRGIAGLLKKTVSFLRYSDKNKGGGGGARAQPHEFLSASPQ